MKKFFNKKEAGTITPLPPTSPSASTSSFGTPRQFEEYQARVASQNDSYRPLSYQQPPHSSRSAGRGSSDEARYAQPFPSSKRRSQPYGSSDPPSRRSSNKYRFSNTVSTDRAPETAYDFYSDPISEQSRGFRPPHDHRDYRDRDYREHRDSRDYRDTYDPDARIPQHAHKGSRQSYQQPRTSGMAAKSPPRALRPAQPTHRHRPNDSMSMGTPSKNAFQPPPQLSPDHHHFIDPERAFRRRSGDYDTDESADEQPHTDARRSTAYPVYAGHGGEQEVGEVLVSQGRYEETVLTEYKDKDKGRGKKLFGFATGSSKEKKPKQDRAPSPPAPRLSRDRSDEGRFMSPPSDSERSKEGWMEKWNKRAQQQQAARAQEKENEDIVASRIGWLSANAFEEQDWMEILPLIDIVSHSEAASKEAARALRKEFKLGTVDTQRRAVRIWALLTLNSSDRFRLQVASRRFLEAVEDTVSSSKTPLSVKETMLNVLGVLAFEFRNDAELASVTKCWNKVRPSDRRKDGEPLENELVEFRLPQPRPSEFSQPPTRRVSQRRSQQPNSDGIRGGYPGIMNGGSTTYAPPMQPPHNWPRHNPPPTSHNSVPPPAIDHQPGNGSGADIVSNLEALAAASMDSRSASLQGSETSSSARYVPPDEDIRRLHEECQIVRSSASVLIDTLLDEGLHSDTSELVDEFYRKVVLSQELVASQIPWASAQADRSREAMPHGVETREERLLADLLEAHGRAGEAIKMVDDARRRLDEEEEERQVTERSKVEVRLDRSALAQDAATGELYDLSARGGGGLLGVERDCPQASGSRSPSPHAASRGPNAKYGALSPAGSGFSATTAASRASRPLPVPRSELSSDSNSTRSGPPHQPQHYQHNPHLPGSVHSSINSGSRHSGGTGSGTHSREASVSSSQFSSTLSPPGATVLSTSPARSLPLTPKLDTASRGVEEEEEAEVQTPIVPSEKALGKRRAVSVRYPSPPQEARPPALPPHPERLVNGVNGLHIS